MGNAVRMVASLLLNTVINTFKERVSDTQGRSSHQLPQPHPQSFTHRYLPIGVEVGGGVSVS